MKYFLEIYKFYKKRGFVNLILKVSLKLFFFLKFDIVVRIIISFIYKDKILSLLLILSGVPISMAIPRRSDVIHNCIGQLTQNKSKLKVLEIGTWCGEGYTSVLASRIPAGSDLYCLDPYKPWASTNDKQSNRVYKDLDLSTNIALLKAKNNLNLYQELYMIKTRLILAESIDYFNEDNFDLIIIDGDHKYKSFRRDLTLAFSKLGSGFIIGDDFEVSLPLKTNLINECKSNLSADMIFSKSISEYVHPGVVLGLQEFMVNHPEVKVVSKNGCFILSK